MNPGQQLLHVVYFTLRESSPQARKKLVASCHEWLSGHEGVLQFSVGVLAEELQRDVNVRDFDVTLSVLFEDRDAHDRYQDHPRHLQFVQENKASWGKVRVFDSFVQQPA